MQKLHFYTISPVSVGTGEKFSPYGDFVIDKEKVYFLNQEKIKEVFQQKPDIENLIEEYVAGVATGMDNNRSHFELKNFLKNRLKVEFEAVTFRVCHSSPSVKGKIHITEIIKNPHFQPYIPGSSLKGAFKGALLYDWLRENQEGKKWIDEICAKLNAKKEERQSIEQQLNKQYESYEIALSDSNPLPSEVVKVYKAIRFHLKDSQKQSGTPQFAEAIQPQIKFETEYRSEKISLKELLKALQKYSQDANQRDIEVLKKFENTDEKLLNFYEDISEKLQNGEYLFKIGSGKGYFFQSVGLAVFKQKGADVFQKFVEVYRPSTKKVNAATFPITKVVDIDTMMPWGWVQVSEQKIEKEEAKLNLFKKTNINEPNTKEIESPKEIKAEYLKIGTKLKQGLEIDAIVVKSGKPNQVKLMLSESNEPVFTLRGYNSELAEGTILVCRIAQINKKGEILDISFSKIKN